MLAAPTVVRIVSRSCSGDPRTMVTRPVRARPSRFTPFRSPPSSRMPFLQLHDTRVDLGVGEARVGREGGGSIELLPAGVVENAAVLAIITVAADSSATLTRVDASSAISVNGFAVGAEPSPLLHGDRLLIDGEDLRFGDDAAGGQTVAVPRFNTESEPVAIGSGLIARTGGRLVSLMDGREYTVGPDGLTLGRDAGCDVVVSATEVSRRHATISLLDAGYTVRDSSTNGVLVNGARVQGSHPIARGDTIAIGGEEFRFYADVAPAPAPPVPVMRPMIADAPMGSTGPRSVAYHRASLASLEIVNEGLLKGQMFEIATPLTHVGRGPHNDVVIAADSMSDSHAKIQKREGGWFVVDLDSTNGTYVGGVRISGEAALQSSVDVRFGGVKMLFRTMQGARGTPAGTRVIVGLKAPDPKRASESAAEVPSPDTATDTSGGSRGLPIGFWLVGIVLALVTVFFILQGR